MGAAGGRATGGSDDGMEPDNKDKIRIRLISQKVRESRVKGIRLMRMLSTLPHFIFEFDRKNATMQREKSSQSRT